MLSLFSSQKKNTAMPDDAQGRVDFTSAIVNYSLAFNEFMALCVSIKVKDIAGSANDLAAACQETSATAEETSATTQQISAGMQQVKEGELENYNRICSLNELAKDANTVLNDMVSNAAELVEQIKNIDSISQSVSEIADKTNLLSLNAAIEAARAGEYGRGFSVVAEEVRKLADQTKTAVKEVKNISNQMDKKATDTGNIVSNVKNIFEQYIGDTARVAEIMSRNVKQVEQSADAVENIANAAQQQAATTEGLVRISSDLASAANFADVFTGITNRINKVIMPHLNKPEEKHILSILAARLIDHANLIRSLIENAGKGLKIASHRECAFGRWYENEYEKYKHIKEFAAIEELHKQFHEAASAFSLESSLIKAKGVQDTSRRMLDAFLKLSKVIC